jgi:hypothetical protein
VRAPLGPAASNLKTFKIGSDCSFGNSTLFRSENHGSFGYDLKNSSRVGVGVARKKALTAKSRRCLA